MLRKIILKEGEWWRWTNKICLSASSTSRQCKKSLGTDVDGINVNSTPYLLKKYHKNNSINIYQYAQSSNWTLIPHIAIIIRTTESPNPVMITREVQIFIIIIIKYFITFKKNNSKECENNKVTIGILIDYQLGIWGKVYGLFLWFLPIWPKIHLLNSLYNYYI